MKMCVTGYCPCAACCGASADGLTATMSDARRRGVAADWGMLSPGTSVRVPGYGRAVVDDRGGAIKGARLDVRFATHEEARAWGRQHLTVYVLEG